MVAKLWIGEGQTTREKSRTLQAIGNGNGLPQAYNDVGEEIVYSYMKV